MKKIWWAASLIGLAVLLQVRQVYSEQALEGPDYRVEKRDGRFEYRQYESYLVAEVSVDGPREKAANQGFSILAGYIFGSNQSRQASGGSEKIAMTSPVTQIPEGDGVWKIRFMMPKKYTLESLPSAQDPRIRFFYTQPERYLVLRFSGAWKDEQLNTHRASLLEYIEKSGLQTDGQPYYAFYNSPFVPPPLRRNEVLVKLSP
jgi:hypothetical protein